MLDGKAITPMKGKGQKSECGNFMIAAKTETEPNIYYGEADGKATKRPAVM